MRSPRRFCLLRKTGKSIMSAPNIYNISLPDDDPAPKDKGAVSPRVGVVTRRQAKPRTPQYSSTPTLSASSSTSGINSISRSTDSDPTASPATRRRLRSRRAKATSRTVNYDNYEDRAYASLATSPQEAEDSEDTQSEQTPLMEGGSVDIPMSDDTEDDDRSSREGFDVLVKILASIGLGTVCIAVFLMAQSYWYSDVPQIPLGFASNTTEVIDTDANMDID
ncbi:hypothetical protein JTE90_008291 [Oedothorax gibbosus]|uniref:Uncharacterized protein n=1 Tax=Oedothorax gibbosus TaxID=931172 RepID=A0AAV6UH48_9ARAC|nr:hypothetical protein JTE90_008291 [Oedothorax gibbosus]